jgi:hypothetical protein
MSDETKKPGRVRYGFKVSADGRTLEEDAGEQRVLELVRELRSKGMSLHDVGRELEAASLSCAKRAPYGYRVDADGDLVPHLAEQLVLAGVRELRDAGLSLADAADELAIRGLLVRNEGERKE